MMLMENCFAVNAFILVTFTETTSKLSVEMGRREAGVLCGTSNWEAASSHSWKTGIFCVVLVQLHCYFRSWSLCAPWLCVVRHDWEASNNNGFILALFFQRNTVLIRCEIYISWKGMFVVREAFWTVDVWDTHLISFSASGKAMLSLRFNPNHCLRISALCLPHWHWDFVHRECKTHSLR